MHLLTFGPTTRDVRLALPGGGVKLVKVTTNDAGTIQHVEDGDHLHGHARPAAVALKVKRPGKQRRGLLLRNVGMPKMRQAFTRPDGSLWQPVPGTEQAR